MLNIDNLKNKMNKTSKPVKSDIYKKHYYLKAFGDSLDEYLKNLTSGNLDNRFAEVFRLAGLKEGEKVLDNGSSNIISIICKRFWGPDIWAIVRKKSEYYKR